MKVVFENLEDEVDQNVIALKSGEIEWKNLLITNETLIANCIAQDVFYTVTDYIQGHKNTIRKLKAQISQLKANKSDEMRHLDYKSLDSQNLQLKETVTSLQERRENFKAKKVKQHYQELFNSIILMRFKTIKKTTCLQTEIENLKTQLKGKLPCVTSNVATPKVSIFEKHAIDVDPLPQPLRNNRSVHNGYLHHLKDTLDTLPKTVKEARSNRPSDNSLEYACVYTKHSQELLEYVNASCPKADNKRDKFIATTPFTKKKHVTFVDPLETSGNNTPKHVKQQSAQQTNVPIIPAIGLSTATTARRSQPKSNTTHDKTSPANIVPKKKVEDHPRKNKSEHSK
ncbi:hypothetical protein Tco_1180986 [Tanacetum coccineum]